jgi:hypothetical protein
MGIMGLSEFAVHNVLRTYSRQERLGSVQKSKAKSAAAPRSTDQVSLSPTGRKIQWLGSLATEVVDRRYPDLTGEERATRVRSTKKELLARHRAEIGQDAVSAEELEARLRPVYLG